MPPTVEHKTDFKWEPKNISIEINESQEIKSYGYVNRKNKVFFRNYRRELKNGNGLSLLDIVTIETGKAQTEIRKRLGSYLFSKA